MTCYLAVHEMSFLYIRRVIDFMLRELARNHGGATLLRIKDTLDEAEIELPAIVYVIGERLPPFAPRKGLFHVLVNFSVVAWIGNPLATSWGGARLIRQKRRLLDEKLPLVDAVLDYYPAQTQVLQRRLDRPVFGFLPCVDPPETAPQPMEARDYDICFVGGISPRRRRVLDAVAAAGFSLSPSSGEKLEDLTARSRSTLNIHVHASNHLEIPRIVGSLSTGTPVVTEHSFGQRDVVDSDAIQAGTTGQLVAMAQALFSDPAGLERAHQSATRAFAEYQRRSRAALATACDEIERRAARG